MPNQNECADEDDSAWTDAADSSVEDPDIDPAPEVDPRGITAPQSFEDWVKEGLQLGRPDV